MKVKTQNVETNNCKTKQLKSV